MPDGLKLTWKVIESSRQKEVHNQRETSNLTDMHLGTGRSNEMARREFLKRGVKLAGAAWLAPMVRAENTGKAMRICLTPGSIGVSADQLETIALAERHGFDAVEPFGRYLASLSDEQIRELVASLKARKLVWGAAGLAVDFRQDSDRFSAGMKTLPQISSALAKAGVDRVGTWLTPAHNSLTYLRNFKQHEQRLREVARVLHDHGQRLGLEYVGTQTSRSTRKYPFVHTLAETKELIAGIATGNVGLVLDSWHWWQAGDTAEDLQSLAGEEVVSVDLNDAPANVPKEQQLDGRRELPCATGVIDLASFLQALEQIGYRGPVRAEPFNKAVNDLDNDAACAATIQAMRKAFELAKAKEPSAP
jgi:sugar phosphate isomerase/epimerase